jgi:hypothetical protein
VTALTPEEASGGFVRLCEIDGCDRLHVAQGRCRSHYRRDMNNGTLHIIQPHGTYEREPFHSPDAPPAFICAEGIDRAYLAISLERPGEMGLILTAAVKP